MYGIHKFVCVGKVLRLVSLIVCLWIRVIFILRDLCRVWYSVYWGPQVMGRMALTCSMLTSWRVTWQPVMYSMLRPVSRGTSWSWSLETREQVRYSPTQRPWPSHWQMSMSMRRSLPPPPRQLQSVRMPHLVPGKHLILRLKTTIHEDEMIVILSVVHHICGIECLVLLVVSVACLSVVTDDDVSVPALTYTFHPAATHPHFKFDDTISNLVTVKVSKVCQILVWWAKNSFHFINIWDVVTKVALVHSVYLAPS